tara:strand:+ start:223 stop:372 length:150 start_codon:yes stop_codon:yes gene_type:complete
MVYDALVEATVGVPDSSQVLESDIPFGRLGDALQETIAPPLFVTASADI